MVVHRAALGECPFPLDKGKGKLNEIRLPSGSKYLRAVIQNAEAVGPNRVEPSYGEIFEAQYGPLFGVQVWCLDVLTTYAVEVPKMVCFLRWHSRTASAVLYILLLKGFCSTLMSAPLSFPLISRVFWWGC